MTFLSLLFFQVSLDYEASLVRDIEPEEVKANVAFEHTKPAHHFHVVGDVGMMLLDVRACKVIAIFVDIYIYMVAWEASGLSPV